MKAYSVDLRKKDSSSRPRRNVQGPRRAPLFGLVSLSSVKRYAKLTPEGSSLSPKKGGGGPLKVDEEATKLLEEDVKRNAPRSLYPTGAASWSIQRAKVSERVHRLRRLLKRLLGFSRKKDRGGDGKRRILQSRLASDAR